MDIRQWLQQALERSNLSQAELARRLSTALGRPLDRAAVNKMVKGLRAISADEMMAISTILEEELPSRPAPGFAPAAQHVEYPVQRPPQYTMQAQPGTGLARQGAQPGAGLARQRSLKAQDVPVSGQYMVPGLAEDPAVFVHQHRPQRLSDVTVPVPLPEESDVRMPILGTANGGADGTIVFDGGPIEWAKTPDYLIGVKGAYAVYVQGESMMPRYRPGERLDVHPNKPAKRYDDVIIQLHPQDEYGAIEGYIKEFVSRTPTTVVVRQYNPPKEIEYPAERVRSVHVVVGMKRE